MDKSFGAVAEEIKKALRFYQVEGGSRVQSVIVSGGSAIMPDVSPVFTQILGLEVVVGNPFSNVETNPEDVKALSGYAPLYSIAVGLAMRRL